MLITDNQLNFICGIVEVESMAVDVKDRAFELSLMIPSNRNLTTEGPFRFRLSLQSVARIEADYRDQERLEVQSESTGTPAWYPTEEWSDVGEALFLDSAQELNNAFDFFIASFDCETDWWWGVDTSRITNAGQCFDLDIPNSEARTMRVDLVASRASIHRHLSVAVYYQSLQFFAVEDESDSLETAYRKSLELRAYLSKYSG